MYSVLCTCVDIIVSPNTIVVVIRLKLMID